MTGGQPTEPQRSAVLTLIDKVELHHADERLDDIVGISAGLRSDDRAAWEGWQRARRGALRSLHRAQVRCAVLAAGSATFALLSAAVHDRATEREFAPGIASAAAVVLLCVAVFIEFLMSRYPGFLPLPRRVRLDLVARERVNLQPLRDVAGTELVGGPRADVARLVVVAVGCAGRVTGRERWRSGRLDELGVRCDVNEVVAQIARGAVEFARAGAASGAAGAADAGATAADWASLVDRLAWLLCYERQLEALAQEPARGSGSELRSALVTDRVVAELRFTVLALTWH